MLLLHWGYGNLIHFLFFSTTFQPFSHKIFQFSPHVILSRGEYLQWRLGGEI